MPSDPKSRARVWIAFLLLFVVMVAASVGAYFLADLGRLQDLMAAREGRAALRGITDPSQIDAALRQTPSNKFLRMIAMATRAADETNAAIEKLSGDIEPPAISSASNLGAASQSDLVALRHDLKTAETNATNFVPNTNAVLKAERDSAEKYAASLQLGKNSRESVLNEIDRRHAEIRALVSRISSARADFYRAYQNYVGVLVGEFGAYKFVGGQFVFPLQRTADRYTVAAQAMIAAAKPIAELDEEQKRLLQSQRAQWLHFVKGE